jgi:hypothetical protein
VAAEFSRLTAKLADIRGRLKADVLDREGKRAMLADVARVEDDLEQRCGAIERHLASDPELRDQMAELGLVRDEVLDQLVRIRVALTSRSAKDRNFAR